MSTVATIYVVQYKDDNGRYNITDAVFANEENMRHWYPNAVWVGSDDFSYDYVGDIFTKHTMYVD